MKRHQYIFYPETLEKLKESGLEQRFLEARKSPDFHFIAHFPEFELGDLMNSMAKRKYFETMPFEMINEYSGMIDPFLKILIEGDENRFKWKIKKNTGIESEETNASDFMILSGYIASLVLGPDELWDYNKFGFSSLFEFLGSFGVLVKDDKKRLSQRGYEWASEFNGQKFITEIGADMHGDLDISRKDITAYETIDPFENKVSYRPELNSDFQLVIGASSVESSVLAILLNYAEHEKVKSEVLEDNGKKFLKEIIEQHGETLRPYLGDYSPSLYFTSFKLSLPRLDENNIILGDRLYSFDRIAGNFERSYGAYVNADGNLVFCSENEDNITNREKHPSLVIPKDEIDHFFKGLFIQASRGLGRTSLNSLVEMMKYRFSDEFNKEI